MKKKLCFSLAIFFVVGIICAPAAAALGESWVALPSIPADSDVYLSQPINVATDSTGNLYVADADNHRIKRYTTDGVLDTGWGNGGIIGDGHGSAPDQFDHPHGMAIDSSNNLWIADTYNERIKRYLSSGALDTSWSTNGSYGEYGTSAGQFNVPIGIVMDSQFVYITNKNNHNVSIFVINGNALDIRIELSGFSYPYDLAVSGSNLYVADTSNNRIKRFVISEPSPGVYNIAPDTSWGGGDGVIGSQGQGAEQFNYATGLALDSSGNMYTADCENHRIHRYTSAGILDTSWGTNGKIGDPGSGADELGEPKRMTLDAHGRLYVAEFANHRVKRYNPDGTVDTTFGSGGIMGGIESSVPGQFDTPYDVAVDYSGNVYVADRNNSRVQRFTEDGVLDTSWFTNGCWQFGSLENMESPYIRPRGVAFYEGRLYVAWTDKIGILYDLKNGLKLTDLTVLGQTVSGFDPNTLEYTVVVSKGATEVTIGAAPFYRYSTVSGTGTHALSSNNTTLNITVSAETGDTQDYSVNVMKSGEDVGLSDLTLGGSTVSGFSENKTSYTVTAPYGREFVEIGATGNNYASEVTGAGVMKLTGDTTVFSVIAKAVDGSAKVY